MSTPILTPDVYRDGAAGMTPLSAEAVNRIWAGLMQALVDQLVPRTVAASNSADIRDLMLVDASNGPVTIQAPQAIEVGQWGVRKLDATANAVTIVATGADVLDEHQRSTYTLTTQDDDAVFAYASPGHFMLWRSRQAALPATTSRYGPIRIGGDLAGTADAITVPGKEAVGVAKSLLDAHTVASDPHGDRAWANQNTGSALNAHVAANDPHGDRAYVAQQFVPLSWFAQDGTLLPSHTSALAITNTFPVNSQAAQLALTAQTGDIAIRTDTGTTYVLQGADPAQFSNWTVMPAIGKVASVNGQQGSVVLGYSDVGAAATNDARITGAQQTSGKNAANGYAGLSASSLLSAAQLPGATSTTYGGIKLTGGLGGTPDAPTVVGKENTGVAAGLLSAHVAATDPHGDRAYVDSIAAGVHQVPAGGALGYALVKLSGNNYDYAWGAVGASTNVQQDLRIVSVRNFGALGDGTTDDTTAIRNALANTPAGGVCYLPPGQYGITGPIVVPPNVTLEGAHTDTLYYTQTAAPNNYSPVPTCSLKVLPAFAGVAAIRILGKTAGGYTTSSVGQRVRRVFVDMMSAPAGIKGVQVFGFVREITLEDVTVRRATDNGFAFDQDPAATGEQSSYPQSNRVYRCVSDAPVGAGFSVTNMPDSTFVDCNAQGCGWHGFYIAGMPNSTLIACRAEWSNANGFWIGSGQWGNGPGSGGFTMNGCMTDRNNQDGILVTATGASSILINSQIARRDGRNNAGVGGGNYAAVTVSGATMPVMIESIIVYPGQDDANNGAITPSPQFGIRALNSTHVAVAGASYIHAYQAPFSDAGGNGTFYRANALGTATGPTTAPVRAAPASATGAPENTNVVAASGAALTLPDITQATIHDVTLTANCALTFPAAANGKSFTLILRQDATGSRTITWPGTVLWPGGAFPTRTTTAGSVDILTFIAVGNVWTGAMGVKDLR